MRSITTAKGFGLRAWQTHDLMYVRLLDSQRHDSPATSSVLPQNLSSYGMYTLGITCQVCLIGAWIVDMWAKMIVTWHCIFLWLHWGSNRYKILLELLCLGPIFYSITGFAVSKLQCPHLRLLLVLIKHLRGLTTGLLNNFFRTRRTTQCREQGNKNKRRIKVVALRKGTHTIICFIKGD